MTQQEIATIPTVEQIWPSLSWWDKFRISRGHPYPIGKYIQPGWTGSLMFYIFRCSACGNMGISYLEGHAQLLRCRHCESNKGGV